MRTKKAKIIIYNVDDNVKFFKAYNKKDIAKYLRKPLSHVNFNSWILSKNTISYKGNELIDLTEKTDNV